MAKKKIESTEKTEAAADAAPKKKAAAPKAAPPKAAAPKAAAAKAPAARKAGKKKSETTASSTPGGTPMVDTGLAAQNVARTLATRAKLGLNAPQSTEEAKESGSFKQLKESLARPASNPLGTVNNALGPQKSNLHTNQYNQIFHNQTQGGVNRLNVPRRTGG